MIWYLALAVGVMFGILLFMGSNLGDPPGFA